MGAILFIILVALVLSLFRAPGPGMRRNPPTRTSRPRKVLPWLDVSRKKRRR